MSRYPSWWTDTITIYNKFEDTTTNLISWQRTVISGCYFSDTFARDNYDFQVTDANVYIVRISKNASYKPHGEWINLSVSARANYFTINQGDIVVHGNVADVINEYSTNTNSNALLQKYKKLGHALTINAYQDNTGTGRGIPHYRIFGV